MTEVGRRSFLKGAVVGGVGAVGSPAMANAEPTETAVGTPAPSRRSEAPVLAKAPLATSGGDFIVDVLRGLNLEFIAFTPGSTFVGIHEAVVNYGMLTEPRLDPLSTMHEEASVAMAHGYAKIAGKPMACIMHTAVGLQHASMAIYNAYCDRAPIFMMVGADLDGGRRSNPISWLHSTTDGNGLVRDFVKWDDTPGSLQGFAESAVRGYKFAMTPPYGPVLLAVDAELQRNPIAPGRAPAMPHVPQTSPPVGDAGAVAELARLLVAADNPVIVADRCARTPEGLNRLIALAEALQAPVCDAGGRMNFPWRHPLNQTRRQADLIREADVVLELELTDAWGLTYGQSPDGQIRSFLPKGARRISISAGDLFMRSNYNTPGRFADVDLAIAADAEATLPVLTEQVQRLTSPARLSDFNERGARLAKAHLDELQRSRQIAALSWDDTPISVPRMCMELYEQIRREDWSLVNDTLFQSRWPEQLWDAGEHYRSIGNSGAYGIGYTGPAALGAALANRSHGRLTVCIQGDGDLMFGPGVLWTAAHEKIPLLYVMHNNRGWHQEKMVLQAQANRRHRGTERSHIGTSFESPDIDFAMMAKSMGVYAEGPVTQPKDLAAAFRRAIAVVKRGEPALVDVICQGR